MHLQHELLLIYGFGDWGNIRAIETVRVWHTFGGTLLCEHGPFVHWKVLKIDKGWFSVNQLEIHLIWENMMMQHSCQGLEYEKIEKNQSKHGVIETS